MQFVDSLTTLRSEFLQVPQLVLRCPVLYVGSGVSQPTTLPQWLQLNPQ